MESKRYIIPGNPIPSSRAAYAFDSNLLDGAKQQKLVFKIHLEQQQADTPPFVGKPLHVELDFYLPIPYRKPKLKGAYHAINPGLENLIRLILQISQGIVFKDNCTIASLISRKWHDENPRVEFTVRVL